jgi:SNF2 family DNA or RNA helicase
VGPREGGSGKIDLLLEKLEGILSSGSKVVIFSQFVGFLKRIEAAVTVRFPNVTRYMLTGATTDRQKPVAAFQSQEGAAVMLISLRAGGTGITLHAADYLFLMDPWWNPAVEDQAIDRVHRIGQKKTVFVYRIVSEGSVESRIQALKAQKKEIFANLVGKVRDNTHFALYFKSMSELISLGANEGENEAD